MLKLFLKMHVLQPKHSKLSQKDAEELLEKYNLSISQLPRIDSSDPVIPKECKTGDIVKIERKDGEKTDVYLRVVV